VITSAALRKIARARLKDAAVLEREKRYDGAVYLCGYVIEIGLKARICQSLRWSGFPTTKKEFEGYQSFRTHDLDRLLHLSGAEPKIRANHLAEWSVVVRWEPEARYNPVGTAAPAQAADMIAAARIILAAL
jgi:hypothetical protein